MLSFLYLPVLNVIKSEGVREGDGVLEREGGGKPFAMYSWCDIIARNNFIYSIRNYLKSK
jgi:hypothetical protein